ncbi:hypothetical protein ACWFNS_12015 [Oerskovia enterophila]
MAGKRTEVPATIGFEVYGTLLNLTLLNLSADDVARLAHESGQHRVQVLTLTYAGLRWGELVALRVKDVELLRRRITVHDNAVQLGVDHAEGLTKILRTRSAPVPQFILDELSRRCVGKALTDLVSPGP